MKPLWRNGHTDQPDLVALICILQLNVNHRERELMETSMATGKKPGGTAAGGGDPPSPDHSDEPADPKLPGEMLMAHLLALLKDWSGYGYELAQRLEEAGFSRYNSGSLYRTLRQMEGLGLISSFWDTSAAGPARRMYSLTKAGQLFLDNWIAMLDFHRRALDIYLGSARRAARGADAADDRDSPPPDRRRASKPSTRRKP